MTNSNRAPEINLSLVKRLISGQFPQWTDLPLEPFNSSGTENAIYRLGEDMFVRLPRGDWAVKQVEKEQRWLPFLAPHLPITIPTPLAFGMPAEGYPWHWSVYRWIKGENAIMGHIDNPYQAATELAQFVTALQRINPAGGPPPGHHNFWTRPATGNARQWRPRTIANLHNTIDTDAATLAWEAALQTPVWTDHPFGSTEISLPGTCWSNKGDSVPSSTSGALAWEIPQMTGCSRGICFSSKAGNGCVQRNQLTTQLGHAGAAGHCQ